MLAGTEGSPVDGVGAVIVAVDELVDAGFGFSPADLGNLQQLASLGYAVWVVDSRGAASRPPHPLRHATSLEEAARRCRDEGRPVLLVGASPSGSIRLANRLHLSSALVAEPQSAQPEDLEETPDFVLASLEDLPGLVARIERDPADFEGTE